MVLAKRFDRSGDSPDLDEAIQLLRGTQRRGRVLVQLAACLASGAYEQKRKPALLTDAMELFQEASNDLSSSLISRFESTKRWALTAYQFGHHSCLAACHAAIDLLLQLPAQHLDVQGRQRYSVPLNLVVFQW
jgi:hypothetical protein